MFAFGDEGEDGNYLSCECWRDTCKSVNLVKTGLTVDSNDVKIGFVLLK